MRRIRSWLVVILAGASLPGCETDGTPRPTTTATTDAIATVERISYEIEWSDGRGPLRKITIPGTLRLPRNATGPVPAVLILHNYNGLDGTGHGHAVNFNSAGYATLEIDMFGPRGRVVPEQRSVLWDVFGGLNYLAARPDIDPQRIAVSGYSYGGILTLLAVSEGLSRSYSRGSGHRFAAHIAYYPLCYFFARSLGGRIVPYPREIDRPTGRPLLIFAGAKDEYEGPDTCEKLKETLSDETRALTTVHTYPNVGHGFDAPYSRTYHDPYACFGNGCNVKHFRDDAVAQDAYRREVEFLRKAFASVPPQPAR